MSTLVMGPTKTEVHVGGNINQTDLLAGTVQSLIAPMTGYWDAFFTVIQTAVTTGGTLTPRNNSQATMNVASSGQQGDTIVPVAFGTPAAVNGLAQTIANSATKGTVQKTNSLPGDPSNLVFEGQVIEILPAGFATAGSITYNLRFRSDNLAVLNPLVM